MLGSNGRQFVGPALCCAILAAGVAKACYYEALNLENPADYYYRWCYAHVSLSPFSLDFSLTTPRSLRILRTLLTTVHRG